MDEPVLRVWMQESVPPWPQYDEWPGRWIAEENWPSPRVEPRRLWLNAGHLAGRPEPGGGAVSFTSPQTTGVRSGEWCAFGADGEMPRDQRPDDGGSLVFDGNALAERVEVLGAPVLEIDVAVDRPVALVAARLCDISPDGSSLRVSYGLLNLTHRDGHAAPEALVPGETYRVRLQLNDCAHAFPAGHRIRIALSTSYWPLAWPSPQPVELAIRLGTGHLDLPVRPARPEDEDLPAFESPIAAPAKPHKKLRPAPLRRTIQIDLATNEMVYTLRGDGGEFEGATLARIEEIDLDIGYRQLKRYRILEADPLSAETELVQHALLRRGGWSAQVDCRTRLSATAEAFRFTADVEAYEDGRPFAQRSWTLTLPRRLV